MSRSIIATGVLALALVGAAPADATLTIGTDLSTLTPLSSGYNCSSSHDCTVVNGSVGSGFGAPGLVSPVTGLITHIRVRTGPTGSDGIDFRLLRAGTGTYTGEAFFGVLPPSLPPNSTMDFTDTFPIAAGDAIGVECCKGGGDDITTTTMPGAGNFLVWGTGTNLPLGNETRAPDSDHTDSLLMLNAEIEPFNQIGVTTAKLKGGTVRAIVNVPNPGVLTASGAHFKQTSLTITSAQPTTPVSMLIKATKAGRKRLRRGAKAKLRFAYTPSYGTTFSVKVFAKR